MNYVWEADFSGVRVGEVSTSVTVHILRFSYPSFFFAVAILSCLDNAGKRRMMTKTKAKVIIANVDKRDRINLFRD